MAKNNSNLKQNKLIMSDNQTTQTNTTAEETIKEVVNTPNDTISDQVTSPVVESKEPVVQELTKKLDTKNNSYLEYMKDLKENGSSAIKVFIAFLEEYLLVMSPANGPTTVHGKEMQFKLYNALFGVLKNSPLQNFKKEWNFVLATFREYEEKYFGDSRVLAYTHLWTQGDEKLKFFGTIINLINLTKNPQTRAIGLKQIDFNKLLNNQFTEEMKNKILTFYPTA